MQVICSGSSPITTATAFLIATLVGALLSCLSLHFLAEPGHFSHRCSLHVFRGEDLAPIFCLLFNRALWFLRAELQVFLVCFKHISLYRYTGCKYFPSTNALPLHFPNSICHKADLKKTFNNDRLINFIFFFLVAML